jgi:hypothetical protein
LFGCSSSLKDYQNTKPEFDLKTFFNGELTAWGFVKNYQNKVTKRFTVDMKGTWQGDQGELYELFKYQDGSTQERTWNFYLNESGKITGTANDVVGEASGYQQGFAFNWNYDLLYESDGTQIKIHLKDWLYQIDDNAVISQAKIQKFGIEVGEVIVIILKQDTST